MAAYILKKFKTLQNLKTKLPPLFFLENADVLSIIQDINIAQKSAIDIFRDLTCRKILLKGVTDKLTRNDNVLNMQITIANCMREAWNIGYSKISDLMEQYDLLAYIDDNYEEYNSMGIKGILLDLREYIDDMGGDD